MALCHSTRAIKAAQTLWHDSAFLQKVEFVDPLTGHLGINIPSIADAYLVNIVTVVAA